MSSGQADSSVYHGLQNVKVPCRTCGDPVQTYIEKGARPPVKICPLCQNNAHAKRTGTRIAKQGDNHELIWLARCIARFDMAGPCETYRPGDPGFAERAAKVQLYGRFMNRPYKANTSKKGTPMTTDLLAQKLRALAVQMRDVAADLDYYGGFNPEARDKAALLAGVAGIADNWADHVKEPPHE